MIKNEYTLKVDLKKKYSAITPTFVQYDTAVLRFILTDDGKPLYFTGQTSIKTYHRRKDGVIVEGDAYVEIVKGQPHIVYEYQGNEMYQLGFVETSLVIYTDKKKVSIQPFNVKIVDNIHDDAATPSNPEYGALQYLIAKVEDLIDRAIIATEGAEEATKEAYMASETANEAAANVQRTIGEWKYANAYDTEIAYKKNNIVTYNGSSYIAIRDIKGIAPTGDLTDTNWRVVARKGEDGEGLVVLHQQTFKTLENQTDFNLSYEYDQHQGRVRVIVDGVEQFTPENFIEQTSTKIRMNSTLRKDAIVKIIYFGNAPAIANNIQLQIDNINLIIEKLNLGEISSAISHATTQGDYAKSQGALASTATTQANAARDSANSAASSANTATTNANTAKDAANVATNKANVATALAESATSGANTAKNDAIVAANNANIARNNANQAAANVNDSIANFIHKDEYSSTISYVPRNIVSYQGSSYMNIVASRGILPTDTTKWKLVGEKGERGFGFTWRKQYNSTTSYQKDDVVYYNGSSYIALKTNIGISPADDGVNWNMITQRGIDGLGSVSSVNGINPGLDGNVEIPIHEHSNKNVIDSLTDDAGQLKYKGNVVGSVTSVNGQTGAITGLETVTSSDSKLSNKVDKVTGKSLSTNDYTTSEKDKLAAISPNANNYVHPDNHPASMIVESDTKQFVSATEKADWNAKETTTGSQAKVNLHANKKDNPHQVTASQVGAYTKAEVDSKTGILSDLSTTDKTDLVKAINEVNVKAMRSDTTEIVHQVNSLQNQNTGLAKEVAYLKLKQDAQDRIDGGTVFAHDMNGNLIGMTLDEANSQNIVIRDGKMVMADVTTEQYNAVSSTVVSSGLSTGNSGRKIAILENGWVVVVLTDVLNKSVIYYVAKNGVDFTQLCKFSSGVIIKADSIACKGNIIYSIIQYAQQSYYLLEVFDATKQTDPNSYVRIENYNVDSGISFSSGDLVINGNEIHIVASGKVTPYVNSDNCRYVKGIISSDGKVTLGSVMWVSTHNAVGHDNVEPCIIVDGTGKAIIFYVVRRSIATIANSVMATWFDAPTGTWKIAFVDNGDGTSYIRGNISAIYVPASVNGLPKGEIIVVWQARTSTSNGLYNVFMAVSIDSGLTYTSVVNMTPSGTVESSSPSISVNSKNEGFLVYSAPNVSGSNRIRYIKKNPLGWTGTPVDITPQRSNNMISPTTISDVSLDFTIPPLIYRDMTAGANVVSFEGNWKKLLETPTLTARAVYNIPSTDFVGAYVQLGFADISNPLTVKAYVNDVEVVADGMSTGVERKFVKQLDTRKSVKLRLDLSRTTTASGNGDAVTRILGGIS